MTDDKARGWLESVVNDAKQKGKKLACGGVLLNDKGHVLLRHVKGEFGGAAWTFPKGRPTQGESPLEAAIREVREETGYDAEAGTMLPGAFEGTTTINCYWLMRPRGEPAPHDSETDEIRWCTPEEAHELIGLSPSKTVRARDWAVLAVAVKGC